MAATTREVRELYRKACRHYLDDAVTKGELRKARDRFLAITDITEGDLDAIEIELGVRIEKVRS